MDASDLGRMLVILGIVVVVFGVLLVVGLPLGRLPGDITLRGDGFGVDYTTGEAFKLSNVQPVSYAKNGGLDESVSSSATARATTATLVT